MNMFDTERQRNHISAIGKPISYDSAIGKLESYDSAIEEPECCETEIGKPISYDSAIGKPESGETEIGKTQSDIPEDCILEGNKAEIDPIKSDRLRDVVMRYLKLPRDYERMIRKKEKRIRDLRSSLTIQSPEITDMPKNPSPPASKLEEAMVKISVLEQEIKGLHNRQMEIVSEMVDDISHLSEINQQKVLVGFYVRNDGWSNIVDRLGIGRRQVSEIRNSGLLELGRYLLSEGRLNLPETDSADSDAGEMRKQEKESAESAALCRVPTWGKKDS